MLRAAGCSTPPISTGYLLHSEPPCQRLARQCAQHSTRHAQQAPQQRKSRRHAQQPHKRLAISGRKKTSSKSYLQPLLDLANHGAALQQVVHLQQGKKVINLTNLLCVKMPGTPPGLEALHTNGCAFPRTPCTHARLHPTNTNAAATSTSCLRRRIARLMLSLISYLSLSLLGSSLPGSPSTGHGPHGLGPSWQAFNKTIKTNNSQKKVAPPASLATAAATWRPAARAPAGCPAP